MSNFYKTLAKISYGFEHLELWISECQFAGHPKMPVIELSYLSYAGEEPNGDGDMMPSYYTNHTEYFSPMNIKRAFEAFEIRSKSENKFFSTDLGDTLEEISEIYIKSGGI